jgi:3D (Asp-Asp-Asp) domain-containing protein
MNVIATALNGAQSECHGSTATKTQFGIQSSPMLETVSPDKLVMAAPSTRGIAVQNRAFKGDSSHHDVDGIGRS